MSEKRLTFLDPYQSQNLVIDTDSVKMFYQVNESHTNTRPDRGYCCQSFCHQLYLSLWMSFQNTFRWRKFEIQYVCELFKIDKTRTTVLRPQSNGNRERFHRTLTSMLPMYCEKDQRGRDDLFGYGYDSLLVLIPCKY